MPVEDEVVRLISRPPGRLVLRVGVPSRTVAVTRSVEPSRKMRRTTRVASPGVPDGRPGAVKLKIFQGVAADSETDVRP